ncbi:RIP metalloprotease RseP [Pseudogemmobacter sonorensis]|uniref:RIP metalloprotease RseP n=1 Tax=Pseudogemmobacter sonorensis TaxID=2989681 RepID=UPI0036C9EC75
MDILGTLGGGLWYVVFFVIALSIIVFIHEYGHYIVGRWCGIHAEVFSLGFGPVLFARRDRRGTQWQLAAIPFGGFVKFMGDADAASVRSTGAEGLTAEERRHTMSGAPLWARTLTVAAGPFANFILTAVVLAGMLVWSGITIDPPTVSRLVPLPQQQALREGDVILAVAGTPTPDAESLGAALRALPATAEVEFTLRRDGQQVTLGAPHPHPPLVGGVQPKSAAVAAGLREGDLILSAGGRDLVTFSDLQEVVFGSEGRPVPLTVWRGGETFELTLTPRPRDIPAEGGGFRQEWLIGIYQGTTFDLVSRAPTLGETLSLPLTRMWDMTAMTFSGLYHMVAGSISTCGMSGVVGIAQTMGDAAKTGAVDFISMIALLSLGIGLLNLFPIPVLDGGHLVFYAYEAVTGRPPADRVLQVLMSVGLVLLLSLMAFALLQDLTCP